MFKRAIYIISIIFLTFVFIVNTSFAEVIKKIELLEMKEFLMQQ